MFWALLPTEAMHLLYEFSLLIVPQIIYMSNLNGTVYNGVLLLTIVYTPYVVILSRLVNRNLINEIKTNETLSENVNKLHQLSITDSLTSTYNRRYFFQASERLIELSKREHKNVSLLMIDLDHFKNINDTYGHNGGDRVLVSLAKIIKKMIRESDIFARIGGEEFAVFLYGSSVADAKNIGQKICTAIENHSFLSDGRKIDMTVSIGAAELGLNNAGSLEALYNDADNKLYTAKDLGRN